MSTAKKQRTGLKIRKLIQVYFKTMALLNKTINELLTDIERGRIALPDMQREFIWENTQIRDLADSLYKNHPIGMILLWQTNPDNNVPITAIDDTTQEISNYL